MQSGSALGDYADLFICFEDGWMHIRYGKECLRYWGWLGVSVNNHGPSSDDYRTPIEFASVNCERSIVIAASAERLFALTQNYGRRLEWDPFLKSAELLAEAPVAGLYVRALCRSHFGFAMETEYVSFHPPKVCAVRMTRGPWILKGFAGAWRFDEAGPDQTVVRFRYHLQARPWWLSWLLTPLVTWVFAYETSKRLRALKKFLEEDPSRIDAPMNRST